MAQARGSTSAHAPRQAAAGAHRFAQRRRAVRRARRRPAVLAASLGTVFLLAVWALGYSSVLAVRTVTVEGTSRLSAAEVSAAAAVPIGTPLARVDLAAVAARVRALAPVARVAVRRQWPHTLVLAVTERVPVAVVPAPGGVTLVDADGVPFGYAGRAPRGAVRLELGGPLPGSGAAAARAALSVWRDLPPAVRGQVTVVRAPTPGGVTLLLSGSRTVVWGSAGDTARKLAVLSALLHRPAHVYDVSAPDVAVTR